MTPILVILGILSGLVLLFSAPLTVSFRYRTRDELTVKAGVPPVMLTLYPTLEARLDDDTLTPKQRRRLLDRIARKEAKREKKMAKKKTKTKNPEKEAAPTEKSPKKKKSIKRNIRFLARFAAVMLQKLGERARVTIRRCQIVVATEDAAGTAYLYGTVSAAVAYLLAFLDVHTKKELSRKQVGVYADFTKDTTTFDIHITLSLTLGGALSLLFHAGWQYVTEKNAPDSRKDANREQPLAKQKG